LLFEWKAITLVPITWVPVRLGEIKKGAVMLKSLGYTEGS